MKFRPDDELLSMSVVRDGTESYVFTVTDGGFAKRTAVEDYRVQGRGGLGIKAMKINEVVARSWVRWLSPWPTRSWRSGLPEV